MEYFIIFTLPVLLYSLASLAHIYTHTSPLSPPQVALLENVRFYKQEEKNDSDFAKQVRCICAQVCVWVCEVLVFA